MSAAYQYHSDLLKLDPAYVDAYLVVGVNNYVVGSLPWYIKALATLTGRHCAPGRRLAADQRR